MRAIEEAAFRAGFTATGLMENAGRAIAEAVRDHLGSGPARPGPGPRGAAGALAAAVGRADAVIDAVLGIGRQRPLGGAIAGALDLLRSRRAPLFAVDLPTGVDADSGAPDPHAAAAGVTL